MKVKVYMGIILMAMALFIYSCENKSIPLPSTAVPNNCDTVSLTYSSGSNTMQAIINANCATGNCHVPGGTAPTDYTTYATMTRYITGGQSSSFWQYLFVNKTMPLSPQPPLDACTQAKFKAWLNAGAPQ